jgi:hypothetical protein
MARLSGSDYRAALELLHEAEAVEGPDPFPEHVLEGLRRLVPCDVVAYHERPVSQPALAYAGEPRGQVTQAIREAHERHLAQDVPTPAAGARKYSDYLSKRQFHRLAFYQEVSRPLGVEDMIRVWIEPSGEENARLEFDRPDGGFRERDRAVLDLLLPHLRSSGAARSRDAGRYRSRKGSRGASARFSSS